MSDKRRRDALEQFRKEYSKLIEHFNSLEYNSAPKSETGKVLVKLARQKLEYSPKTVDIDILRIIAKDSNQETIATTIETKENDYADLIIRKIYKLVKKQNDARIVHYKNAYLESMQDIINYVESYNTISESLCDHPLEALIQRSQYGWLYCSKCGKRGLWVDQSNQI